MNKLTDEELGKRVSDLIVSLCGDRELGAYMAGILTGFYIAGLPSDVAMILFREALQSGNYADVVRGSEALARIVGGDVLDGWTPQGRAN